jgi:hypothetical protein
MSTDYYLSIIVNAFCTGIGVSLGSYFTNRMLLKHITEEKKQNKEKENEILRGFNV